MSLLSKIYAETLKDFVDFYRWSWQKSKWRKHLKTIPKVDRVDFFVEYYVPHWTDEMKHELRMEEFELRMKEYNKGRWFPNWARWLLDVERLEKPVFKADYKEALEEALRKRDEAEAWKKKALPLLWSV